MQSRIALVLVALLATLVWVPRARADYLIHGSFEKPNGTYLGGIRTDEDFNRGVNFHQTSPSTQTGTADLVVGTFYGWSSVDMIPVSGQLTNGEYLLQIHLEDVASQQSGVLTFHGTINANVGYSPLPTYLYDVSNVFTEPSTQSLTLGANHYQVSILPFTMPPGGVIYEKGEILAHVDVSPAVAQAPEPSAFLLGSAGAAALALFRRRGRPTASQA